MVITRYNTGILTHFAAFCNNFQLLLYTKKKHEHKFSRTPVFISNWKITTHMWGSHVAALIYGSTQRGKIGTCTVCNANNVYSVGRELNDRNNKYIAYIK